MLRFQSPPSTLSQKSWLTNPLQVQPLELLRRQLPVSTAFFYVSLEFLNKLLLIKKISPFSRRPWERIAPPMFPKMGPLRKQTPISRTLLGISLGVPSKRALPPGYPHRAPTERQFPEPLFMHLSKSLVN